MTSSVFAYSVSYYEKFYPQGGSPDWYLYSPFYDGSDRLYPTITSKFNNPRNYTPHGGVDMRASENTPIYPVARGIVTQVVENDSVLGNYIEIKYDIDMDGSYSDDNTYGRHAHLNNIEVSKDEEVTPTDRIGLSGSTGTSVAHLHIDLRYGDSADWYHCVPWSDYFYYASDWNYGKDLDWLSYHDFDGRTLSIYCYGKNSDTVITPSEVMVYVRKKNTNDNWEHYSMSYEGSYKYSATIPSSDFPDGTDVEIVFSGKRSGLSSSACPYGLYPSLFKAPDIPYSSSSRLDPSKDFKPLYHSF